MRTLISLIAVTVLTAASSLAAPTSRVYFKNLKDGDTVTSPIKIEMGIEGMNVAKAGDVKSGEGHHHLLVDGQPVNQGDVIAKDDTHLHYGNAQTETELVLTPGPHTLTLQFADGAHRSFGPGMASTVHINVAKPKS